MTDKNDKKRDLFYVTHSGELLVWLIVVLTIVAFTSLGFSHKERNDENDYQVFLPDIDGLIVGSPVRMMGIPVGHVVKLKPIKDEVYVKFVITDPELYIPHGTQVTVEFSGMAGSKSLELYLPDKNTYIDKTTPLLTVNPPKRLHDALWLLDNMYKKITSIIYSMSSFGTKLDDANLKSNGEVGSPEEINSFLNYSNDFIDTASDKANELRTNIEGFRDYAKKVR